MAKKRVNYKFLIFLGVPVLLLVGLAVAYKTVPQLKWMVRGTPQSHVDQGKSLYAQGKYADAAEQYKRAIQLNGGTGNPAWFLAVADCYDHLILDDPQTNLSNMRGFLQHAITTDPNYEPALRKELKLSIDLAEQSRGQGASASWAHVAEDADALLAAVPKDREASIAKNRALIQQFVLSGKGTADTLEKASAELLELANQQPFDADALANAISAKVAHAADQQRQSDRDGANKSLGEALSMLETALKANPDNAALHIRAANFIGPLMGSQPNPDPAKIGARILAEAEAANRLIKPQDPHFTDAKLTYARALQSSGKSAAAIAIYDELIKAKPADVPARLIYAEYLGNLGGKAPQALKLLEDIPPHAPGELLGVQAAMSKNLDFGVLSERLTLQLQIVPTLSHDEAEKMLATMDEEYARLTANGDQNAQAQYLRGEIEMVRGKDVDAVQTLNRAATLVGSSSDQSEMRGRILYALAQANLRTRQTGRAKELLLELARENPRFVPAQILLIQTLLDDRTHESMVQARGLLDGLDKIMPNNPQLARLRVMSYDKKIPEERAALEKTFASFPQDTTANIIEKAHLAEFLDHRDQAIELLSGVNNSAQATPEVAAALADAYANNNQKDKALATIDAALAKTPDQPTLKILRARFAGGDINEVTKDIAEKITDPFEKEMALYQLAANESDAEGVQAHLNAAEKLKPDDGHVKDLLFQMALRRADFDRASQLLQWLSSHNQDQANGLIFKTRFALAQASTKQGEEQNRLLHDALNSAQQLTQQLPEFAESWLVLGSAQMSLNNYTEAEQSFAAAVARQSNNVDAMVGQIDAVHAQGRADYEKSLITSARSRFPQEPRLAEQEIRYDLTSGNPQDAIAPREAQLKATLARKDANPLGAYFNLAQAYLVSASHSTGDSSSGFYEKALSTANDGLKVDPKNLQLIAVVAESCLQLHRPQDGEAAMLRLQEGIDVTKNPNPPLMLAEFYERSGNAAKQEKTLRDLLAAAPDVMIARINLTNLLAHQNRLDDALTLLPADSDKPAILKQRIDLLTNFGRYADAAKEIDAQLAKTNDPSSALLDAKARVMAASGNDAQALTVLNQALAKNPNDLDAMYYRAKIHLARADNFQQAVNDLREVVRLTNNFDARMALATALSSVGDVTGAIQIADETVNLRKTAREPRLLLVSLYTQQNPPRWPQAEQEIDKALAEPTLAHDPLVLNTAAQLWLNPNHRDADKALKLINDALAVVPNDPTLEQTKLQALLAVRKPRDVLSETQPLLDAKDPPTWVYLYRGQAHTALDDKQAAMDDYSAGIGLSMARKQNAVTNQLVLQLSKDIGIGPAKARITPMAEQGDPRWQLVLSNLCQLDHDLPAAKQWVEKLLANEAMLAPDVLYAARTQAGQLYLISDPPDAAKAVDIYNKILQHDPTDLNALNNLANTMILPNSGASPADALKAAHRAADQVNAGGVAVASYRPYVFDTLGWAQVLNGDPSGAVQNLRESLDARPLPDAAYHLGEAYLAMKPPQADQALAALNQAQGLLKNTFSSDSELASKIAGAIARAQSSTTAPASPK